MASVRDLAQLSEAVYKFEAYKGWLIDENFKAGSDKEKDNKLEFQAALYYLGDKEKGEQVVVFCGSNFWPDWKYANAAIVAGLIPDQARQAVEFFEDIVGIKHKNHWEEDIYNRQADTPTYDITITGHSLGGVLATIVGNKYALHTVAFNSPGTSGLTTRTYDLDDDGNITNLPDPESGERAGYSVELQPSKEAWDNIHQYIISNDSLSNGTGHFGQEYRAQAFYDSEHLSAHFMNQWLLPKRYDGEGNYDPSNEINKPPESLIIENSGD